MATAALWLAELGTPPPDVCLDWSRQLRNHYDQHLASSLPHGVSYLAWENVQVSETGMLSVEPSCTHFSIDNLLAQLHSWCADGSASRGLEIARGCEIETADKLASAVLEFPIDKPFVRRKPQASAVPRWLTFLKGHRLAALAGCLVVATGLCWFALSATASKSPPAKSTRKEAPKEQMVASENGSLSFASDFVSAADLADLSIAELAPLPTLEDVIDNPAMAINAPSSEPKGLDLAGTIRIGSPAGASSIDVDENAMESAVSDSVSIQTQYEGVAAGHAAAEALKEGDVMRDMAELTKSAEEREVESQLNVQEAKGSDLKSVLEPLVIKTSPMVQTHTLPGTLARPREPVWSIAVAVDDEFQIEPKESQRVVGRQTATWLLSNADAKSPATKFVIQAQLAPGRQAGLRWRIAASAEDLPALALPVAKDSLRLLQQRLQSYIELTRNESQRLGLLSQTAEKEWRTLFSKQRAALEAQNKLASRIATIAAESQLLDDLLRSQLTLYVELFEGDKSDSPLLRFGDPAQLVRGFDRDSKDVKNAEP